MKCRSSLRAFLRVRTRGVASASLINTTSHAPAKYSANASALNPVARSSSAESVAASANTVTMLGSDSASAVVSDAVKCAPPDDATRAA
eukprot:6196177-Pleurochrysis_carterae.AAC.1